MTFHEALRQLCHEYGLDDHRYWALRAEAGELAFGLLNQRARNALMRNNIHTVAELELLADGDLRDLRGIGDDTITEIRAMLALLNRTKPQEVA